MNIVFIVLSALLTTATVNFDTLKPIHDAGSLIFVSWLLAFVVMSFNSSKAKGGEH